jgi:hypothetical protein
MTFSLRTHVPKRGKTGEAVIARVSPYVRLRKADEATIFIQGGSFYYDKEGGEAIKVIDLPEWVGDELAKMTPQARREVGLGK